MESRRGQRDPRDVVIVPFYAKRPVLYVFDDDPREVVSADGITGRKESRDDEVIVFGCSVGATIVCFGAVLESLGPSKFSCIDGEFDNDWRVSAVIEREF